MNQNDQALALLQAEQMRLMAKKDTISQDFLVISYALGLHFYTRRNYTSALPHFEKALALQEKINPNNFADLADILSWKGLCVKRIMPQQEVYL